MQISHQWLREWVEVSPDPRVLEQQLTTIGLEVEALAAAPTLSERIVVAAITEVQSHPNADTLQLCTVDVGADSEGQAKCCRIVCGAPNVVPGMKAPLAKIGARLPDGRKIKKSKIRGQPSEGMLCSADELALGEDADGILALPADAPIGDSLNQYLGRDDVCITLSGAANRSDWLGMIGIARDLAALNRLPMRLPEHARVTALVDDALMVELLAPDACPRYVGRIIRGIDATAPTPMWLQERLRRAGLRPISAVVDITNYVMLEFGQPLHAFDLARIDGGIRVRYAAADESLQLLDGGMRSLSTRSLVIADHRQAIGLAGIMGGLGTAVSPCTVDVFLEAAWFKPRTIFEEARRSKPQLSTDAAYRFERRLAAIESQERAIERATRLLMRITGGAPGPLRVSEAADQLPPKPPPIALRRQRIRRLLGVAIPDETVVTSLAALGFEVTQEADGWRVQTPPFRADVSIEADLIEEIVRIDGYHKLPPMALPVALAMRPPPQKQLSDNLVQRGYQEVITYSFIDPAAQQLDAAAMIRVNNPIASDLALMRASMWPGLLRVLQYNLNRQQQRLRVFEYGPVFVAAAATDAADGAAADTSAQRTLIAGLAYGAALPQQWGVAPRETDFFDCKADLLALFPAAMQPELIFERGSHVMLHPQQTARVMYRGQPLGLIGGLHPRHVKLCKIEGAVWLFEVDPAPLMNLPAVKFASLSRYPAVRRDLSIALPTATPMQTIKSCISTIGIDILQTVECFDVYRDDAIGKKHKSIALSFCFRHQERTLSETEIDTYMDTIMSVLADSTGAQQRAEL